MHCEARVVAEDPLMTDLPWISVKCLCPICVEEGGSGEGQDDAAGDDHWLLVGSLCPICVEDGSGEGQEGDPADDHDE